MTSEVRKVLDSYSFFEILRWLTRLDAAERADAAKREEPVQELRRKVAELVARWGGRYVHLDAAVMVRNILAELNAIIATKPDPVENRQAAASGPVMHESVWCDGKNVTPATEQTHDMKPVTVQQVREIVAEKISEMVDSLTFIQEWKEDWKKEEQVDQWREIKPVIEPAVAEKVYEIASRAVRDAMPDVLEKVADALEHDCEFDNPVDMLNMYAAKLREERGA